MTPYKTNSALYLDYLATMKTRQQIEADPRLCVFLNNPYIKDNMEIALLYNAARTGDYSDKMAFVEYLMCNGPELDADTILHYRTRVALDPVCTEIAYSYYNDVTQLEELRKTKYGKGGDGDDYNCFTKPCFYMGRFSASVGKHATYENAKSIWNCFGEAFYYSSETRKKRREAAQQQATPQPPKNPSSITRTVLNGAASGARAVDAATNPAAAPATSDDNPVHPSGNQQPEPNPLPVEYALGGWIPTSLKKGWGAITSLCTANFKDTCIALQEAGNLDSSQYGDPLAAPFTAKVEILKNANIKRVMGDCARLWDHARRLEIFNVASNASSPISPSAEGSNSTNGLPNGANRESTAGSAVADSAKVNPQK